VAELEPTGGERAAHAVGIDGGATLARLAYDDRAPIGEAQVHLQVALVPRFGERFDADARQPDDPGVVGDPHRRALAELRVVGTLAEEVVARRLHPARQVDRHELPPGLRNAEPARCPRARQDLVRPARRREA
jgi:hypothetical protein